ncbi:cysteine peptidase family C39 domain-containing protein [Staphylococcus felis]|uniref:cysteine peptidase family C39 domain-containing protein n=1 Tax=Staphylococcus felis TaxID=46127 RepID=UPI00247FA697|nr:cysteine peptidase family C39 domain-containing protein [Staphylococcus felis]
MDFLKDISFKREGYNLKDMIYFLEMDGDFKAHAIELNMERLEEVFSNLTYPIILHENSKDDLGHYIVVYKYQLNKKLVVSDPKDNSIKKVALKDIKHKLSGICLKIEKTKDPITFQFENQKNNTIKKFIKVSFLPFSFIFILGSVAKLNL